MINGLRMSTSDEYLIRDYEKGEEQEIVQLLKMVFKEWNARGETALDHWRWKYEDNPWGGKCAVAVKENKIVAASHDLYLYIKVGDKSEKTVYATDVAVHPNHRQKGLHTKMQNYRGATTLNFGLRYGYTTNKILIKSTDRRRKKGINPFYQFPVEVNRYLLIDDVDKHIQKKKIDYPWIQKQGYKIKKWMTSKQINQDTETSNELIEIKSNLDLNEADLFWDNIKTRYNFITEKKREYIEWRYLDPRAGNYQTLSAFRGNEYCGYIVFSIDYETPDYPMGIIIDISTNGEMEVGKILIQKAITILNESKINAISAYTVNGSHTSQLLESQGFIDRGETMYLTYVLPGKYGKTHPVIENLNAEHVHLMHSDFYVK